MPRYLSLLSFTDQGIANVRQSAERAGKFRATIEAAGGSVLAQYWAMGEFDGCVIFEVPDDTTAAAQLLSLGKLGNVRTRTLQVFDESEFTRLVAST